MTKRLTAASLLLVFGLTAQQGFALGENEKKIIRHLLNPPLLVPTPSGKIVTVLPGKNGVRVKKTKLSVPKPVLAPPVPIPAPVVVRHRHHRSYRKPRYRSNATVRIVAAPVIVPTVKTVEAPAPRIVVPAVKTVEPADCREPTITAEVDDSEPTISCYTKAERRMLKIAKDEEVKEKKIVKKHSSTRPPVRLEERVTRRPSRSHVWVAGYWKRSDAEWTWIRGCWVVPPVRGARWISGKWVDSDGGWKWEAGYWKAPRRRR